MVIAESPLGFGIDYQSPAHMYDQVEWENFYVPDRYKGLNLQKKGNFQTVLSGLLAEDIQEPEQLGIFFETAKYAFIPEKGRLNEDKAGAFLRTVTEVYNSNLLSPEAKKLMYDAMNRDFMEAIADISAKERWSGENAEAALHAYCTFMDIEKLYGEEAEQVYQTLGRNITYARNLDIVMEKIPNDASRKGTGNVIYLGNRGAEVAQVYAQHALNNTAAEYKAQACVDPYYRDHASTLDFDELAGQCYKHTVDPSYEPESNGYMTALEAMAELARVQGSPRGAGTELPVKGKLPYVFLGTPDVGGSISPGLGYAYQQRLRTIHELGIEFTEPRRADATGRDIQLENTGYAMMISLGDGAWPYMEGVPLEIAAVESIPAFFLVQNNEVLIGAESHEHLKITELAKKGHGADIPGIRVELDDPDKIYMATRFAAKRSLLDAGQTIIEAMTKRLLAHSSQHGDHLTAQFTSEAIDIITAHAGPESQLANLAQALVNRTQSDNQLKLKDRIIDYVNKNHKALSKSLIEELKELLHRMIDPVEHAHQEQIARGYYDNEDVKKWDEESAETLNILRQEVLQRELGTLESAQENTRLPTPHIEFRETPRIEEMNGAEAYSLAIRKAMEINPRILMRGSDVNKGLSADGKWQGGYFTQEEGLFPDFGKVPGRYQNSPLAERWLVDYFLGMGLTGTNAQELANAYSVIYDPQYADYGIQGWPGMHVWADLLMTSGGKYTSKFGYILHSGAAEGGATKHSYEVASVAMSTPSNVDILYATTPQDIYEMTLYNSLYNPNPYILMIDRYALLGVKQKFEIGPTLTEPGRARIIQPGGDMQIISYGPMTRRIKAAVKELGMENRIGHIDMLSLRPFPEKDVLEFLSQSNGPILMAHEEPADRGVGGNIIQTIFDMDSPYAEFTIGRKRKSSKLAATRAPLSTDKRMMYEQLPSQDRIKKKITRMLAA